MRILDLMKPIGVCDICKQLYLYDETSTKICWVNNCGGHIHLLLWQEDMGISTTSIATLTQELQERVARLEEHIFTSRMA